jgi:uncharacterized membrane protein
MTQAPSPTPNHRGLAAVLAVAWLALLGLALGMPPDGVEHADWAQFIGRFHPLAVHAPIAILLVAALTEALAARGRDGLREAAGWLLALGAVACVGAALDGWFLAWSEGLRGRDVTRHLWGGVALAGVATVALAARCGPRGAARSAYPLLLTASLVLMVWTAHLGGSISYGEGYLTDKAPAFMKGLLGIKAPAVAGNGPAAPGGIKLGPWSSDPSNPAYYVVHVAPILSRSCMPCHKADKHKAGLRVDSYALLMKGGDNGPAVVAGDPAKSDLLRRVKLPSTDDDYMPSDNLRALTPEETAILERWIAAGAHGG